MKQLIFQERHLYKRSFLQRLFGQFPEENAIIELNNLLASKPIKDISARDIKQIENFYNVSLNPDFHLNLEEFYAVFYNTCFKNGTPTIEDLDDLQHLKTLLKLDEISTGKIDVQIGEIIFTQNASKIIQNGKISSEKRSFLNKLRRDLNLSTIKTEEISTELKNQYILKFVDKIIEKQSFSPLDEQELQSIAIDLDTHLKFDDSTKKTLHKLKQYWQFENGELKSINSDVNLQKSEICYFETSSVNWYEIRITRGVGYLTLIDNGTIYLSNKRIIFVGNLKNINIPFPKILNITTYIDGVEIHKESGKSPTLQFSYQGDIFNIILKRLLNEHSLR